MNCSDIRQRINGEIVHGKPLLTHDAAVVQHIRHCDLCRSLYTDAVLTRELREMQMPEPRPGFAALAIRNAVKRNRMKQIRSLVGISAAAMLILAAGLVFTRGLPDFAGRPAPSPNAGLTAPARMEKTVRVMIEARQSRQNATLAIDLAENIALKNFPGHRQLTWQTELTQGRNLLELPLVFADDAEGYVNIRYHYNGSEQQVRIPVQAGKEHEPQTTITS